MPRHRGKCPRTWGEWRWCLSPMSPHQLMRHQAQWVKRPDKQHTHVEEPHQKVQPNLPMLTQAKEWVTCNICNTAVRSGRLQKHIRSYHMVTCNTCNVSMPSDKLKQHIVEHMKHRLYDRQADILQK